MAMADVRSGDLNGSTRALAGGLKNDYHRIHASALFGPFELGTYEVAEGEIRSYECAARRFGTTPYRVAVQSAGEDAVRLHQIIPGPKYRIWDVKGAWLAA
jgi:hypothetical protein